MVGLPDKAVSQAKERVRAALVAPGLALPARRITINLAPADLAKEGAATDRAGTHGRNRGGAARHAERFHGVGRACPRRLDPAVAGARPAAIGANSRSEGLICSAACGPEAAWASPEMEIIAPSSLVQLANHFKGT